MKLSCGSPRRAWLCFAAATCWWPVASAFSQSDQRQLKDLFDLQWLLFSRGRPEAVTAGDIGQWTLTAAAPCSATTNPQSMPAGGSSDVYFNPWVSVEWRKPAGEGTSWYVGGAFVDYQYVRFPELDYAFAEASTGLSSRIAKGKALSVDGYLAAAMDCNLMRRFSVSDFEVSLSAGAVFDIDLGKGHEIYLTPDFTVLGAFPESSASNSSLSESLTAGWTWQFAPTLSLGAYWSGSANQYPVGGQSEFTQYVGASLDWQFAPAWGVNVACVETLNASSDPSSRYTDFSASIALRASWDL